MNLNWTFSLLGGFGETSRQKGESANYIGNLNLLPYFCESPFPWKQEQVQRHSAELLATSAVAEVGKIPYELCIQIF